MPIKFKLPVPKSKYYFSVFIFEDREGMYARNTMLSKKRPTELRVENFHDAIVIKQAELDLKNGGYKPKIGEIHMMRDCIDQEVVSHEICHAVFWWFLLEKDIEKFDLSDCVKEEEFCSLHGKLTNIIVKKLHKYEALEYERT